MVFKAAEDWIALGQHIASRVMCFSGMPYSDVDQSDDDKDRKGEHNRVERDRCADGCDLRKVSTSCVSLLSLAIPTLRNQEENGRAWSLANDHA